MADSNDTFVLNNNTFILSKEINKSNAAFSIRNFGDPFAEQYELTDPYMLIYMSNHIQSAESTCFLLSPTSSFRSRYSTDAYSRNRVGHRHDFYELMLVLSGEITSNIEGKRFVYREGEACMLNKNVRHYEHNHSAYEAIFISLSDSLLAQILHEGAQTLNGKDFEDLFKGIRHLERQKEKKKYYDAKEYINFIPTAPLNGTDVNNKILPLLNHLVMETLKPDIGSLFFEKGLLARILSILENKTYYEQSYISVADNKEEMLLGQVISILEKSDRHVSRRELSDLLHYNGDYLNRIVKKYTGRSLGEFSQFLLLKKAKELITDSETSISEIVSNLGFSNRSFFYKIFKEQYGFTPNKIREAKS